MAKMTIPDSPTTYTRKYTNLKGCDFTTSDVDLKRSPDCLNMISDEGGNPRKRHGWEEKLAFGTSEVYDMWPFVDSGKQYILISAGTKLCVYNATDGVQLTTEATMLKTGKKAAIYMTASGLYVLDGTRMLHVTVSNGDAVYTEATPYAPLFVISRSPTGGGTLYEEINLLTRQRSEQFVNTSGNMAFIVTSSSGINTAEAISVEIVNTTTGEWEAYTGTVTISGSTVTLSTSPQPIQNADNVRITYYALGDDYSGMVLNCDAAVYYTEDTSERMFVTGNLDYPNTVWFSDSGDALYWPDINYLTTGSAKTKNMGFLTLGENLAVIKEKSEQEPTVYFLYSLSLTSNTVTNFDGSITTTTIYTYGVKSSATGVGAVSKYAFGTLNDEPLFLSDDGICGIVSTDTTSDKIIRNRSRFIDSKLLDEGPLESAVSVNWNNYYILSVNSHCYLLDGRNKTSDASGNTSYLYEAFYWDNVPAKCFATFGKELWFGTSSGKICKFREPVRDDDMSIYYDGTDPITAVWSTPDDDDGVIQYFKTMIKKGSLVTLKPFRKSSVDVYIEKDGNPREYIGSGNVNIFTSWEDLAFEDFSFNSNDSPRDKFFRKKVKKYKRLKLVFVNDKGGEGFGINGIVKTYTMNKFSK